MAFLVLTTWGFARMTPEERDRMNALCILIQNENDPKNFNCLIEDLERLLNTKRERIQASEKASLGAVEAFEDLTNLDTAINELVSAPLAPRTEPLQQSDAAPDTKCADGTPWRGYTNGVWRHP